MVALALIRFMSANSTPERRMVEIYSLTKDAEQVLKVQRATLKTTDYGLVPEQGLFGSEEWWEAISAGRLSTLRVEGVISRVYMGGMNDWPEFEIDSNGQKSTWSRSVNRPEDDHFYAVGKRVSLDYVIQKFKKDLANRGKLETEVVLRIVVER